MLSEHNIGENALLIVTGSTLRAEQADRPLAYELKAKSEEIIGKHNPEFPVIVLSDLWYLNSEPLQKIPVISVGGPGVNAASAYLYKRLPNAFVIDNTLVIQMDMTFADFRASLWGTDHQMTVTALEIFVGRGYLDQYIQAVLHRAQG
jgi:hypothetical protein